MTAPHSRPRRSRTRMIIVGFTSFLLGRLISINVCLVGYPQASASLITMTKDISTRKVPDSRLGQQIQDQHDFQALINETQNPTICTSRYLVRGEIPPKDGFASEVQYISRLLQVAVSTRRILWISRSWKSAYCPPNHLGGWTCLWQPLSHCSPSLSGNNNAKKNRTLLDTAMAPMNYGILPQRARSAYTSPWFDPLMYSSRPILPAPISFPLKHSTAIGDVIPHWERAYGRYWIRSQMAHYLWQPTEWLAQEIRVRTAYPTDQAFVGVHIRFTDNIPDFAKSFGRNATYTRQLAYLLELATNVSQHHQSLTGVTIRDIYIATDHSKVLDWAREIFVGWTVWGQESSNVQRATTQNRVWFAKGRSSAAGAMAADLEVLRRADYLLGSFQSNVFRLAAQLNTAWNVHRYSVRIRRHFTVDVEWFEDP